MKLWGGRFTANTDKAVDDFHSSIHFDSRMYRQDIEGSIAHAEMLGRVGVIPAAEAELICSALKEILSDIENGKVRFKAEAEDIHMNVEKILIERIGDIGKKLHTGRSRNDQVALDLRMYLKAEAREIRDMLLELLEVLLDISENNTDTIMPGYTHLQRAQPITLGHHAMAYFQMFKRDVERLDDCYARMNVMPLGSGALAGTTYPLDRHFVAEKLGFSAITENSLDGVSDRDFVIELASCLAIIMMHLSRYCEELILWSSAEFSFIEMDDAFSTGSSIMPQRKTDVAELIRARQGASMAPSFPADDDEIAAPCIQQGHAGGQESIFDAVDTVRHCLPFSQRCSRQSGSTGEHVQGSRQLYRKCHRCGGLPCEKGIPFRSAHEIVGKMVLYCISNNKALDELTPEEFKGFSPKMKMMFTGHQPGKMFRTAGCPRPC